jgi:hypothetical protein
MPKKIIKEKSIDETQVEELDDTPEKGGGEKKSAKDKVSIKENPTNTSITKVKLPPVLFEKTQTHIHQLSQIVGCPVLAYFKPPNGNIWSQDLYAIMECLKVIGKVDKLAVYIRSDGGSPMVSLRIIHLLRSFVKKLVLLAPSECASAATMLALGCDEIYMGPLSSLSPVDSSLTHALSPLDKLNNKVSVSLDELSRVVRLWNEAGSDKIESRKKSLNKDENNNSDQENPYKYLYQFIHPLVFGAVDRYSSLSIRICREILSYHIDDENKINEITRQLNYDYPAHGYPITLREARRMGLPVKEISQDGLTILNELQLLYSEMTEEKITDYDRSSYHDNTIYSLVEAENLQIKYEHNYDKFYLEGEKRYITINDQSGWHKTILDKKGKPKTERVFF